MPSGNEVTVSVSNQSPVTVTVPGSVGSSPTITNGGTANVSVTSVGDRGPQGDVGPATTLSIGTITTGAAGSNASATLAGPAGAQVLSLTIPRGDTGLTGSVGPQGSTGATGPAGPANSLSVGTVTTGAAGSSATATITGTAPNQTLSLAIPRGDTGLTGATGATGPANTLTIGTVTTGAAGSSASATVTGTAPNQTLNFTIPRGDTGNTGETGPANTLTIGTVTTGAAGSSATAAITGTAPNQTLNITIPRGDTGSTGAAGADGQDGADVEFQSTSTHLQWRYAPSGTWTNLVALSAITGPQGPQGPATIAIGTVTTGAAGSNATVTNSGTSSNVVLDFSIPQGQGGTAGVSWQPVPMSPSASGTNGDIAYDASFLYVKSASGWRRTAIATWTPLGAPTSVSATGGNAQATVSWTAPVDNGGYAITDYAVQYSSDNGTTWTTFADGTSTTTTATVTGLTNGTAYVFRVAAINAVGTGPYSSATSSVTPGTGDPFFSNVSLLLHMDGSDNGTVFADSSSNNLPYTSSGVTTSTTEKRFGPSSAYSPNANSHVTYLTSASGPLHFGAGDFTVEFWIKQDGTQSDPRSVIGSACNTQPYWVYLLGAWDVIYSTSGRLKFLRSNGNNTANSLLDFAIPTNAWTHVAIVRSGVSLTAFVDGAQAQSATIDNSLFFTTDGYFGLFRHDIRATSGLGSVGYIDELRITKGVARYTANFTPPTAPFPDA